MSQRVTRKWRPPLALIVGGAMAGVAGVPLVGIAWFRVAGNILGWAETAWLIGWLGAISAAVLGFLLWRLVLRPVNALTAHARAMKAGRVDTPLPAHFGTPEFSDLGQSVIDMGETLHNRAAGMRAYAGHVTHELKSPLTAIVGAAELLDDVSDPDDRKALARMIREAATRMERLLDDLRRHAAAGQEGVSGSSDLVEVAGKIDPIGIEVLRSGRLPMPEAGLHAVLTQLAQNAVSHGATKMTVDWVDGTLMIEDDGTGIAVGNRDRVFDPFFTTRRGEGGTGMGLSVARALVEAQGGQMTLVDSEKGARFDIRF
jgi:signal transduction histidine kinase